MFNVFECANYCYRHRQCLALENHAIAMGTGQNGGNMNILGGFSTLRLSSGIV